MPLSLLDREGSPYDAYVGPVATAPQFEVATTSKQGGVR